MKERRKRRSEPPAAPGATNELPRQGGFQIHVLEVIVGVFLTLTSLYALFNHREVANWVHRYFQTRPQYQGRPAWLYKQYRPSQNFLRMAVIVFFLYGLGVGIVFIIQGAT